MTSGLGPERRYIRLQTVAEAWVLWENANRDPINKLRVWFAKIILGSDLRGMLKNLWKAEGERDAFFHTVEVEGEADQGGDPT